MLCEEDAISEINTALTFGIKEAISCSTSFASNQKNLNLSRKNSSIKAGLGLYPIDAIELNENELARAFDFFEENIKDTYAIGEIGLDFKMCKNTEEQNKQKNIFEKFLTLSEKYKKPVIIHSRYAQTQVLEILSTFKTKKIILHSFIDSGKLMKKAADQEYFVSAGCSTLYNTQVQERIKEFPLNNLLFETDSPIYFNNEKATPKKIKEIAQKTAELKKTPYDEIETQVEKTYQKIFNPNF